MNLVEFCKDKLTNLLTGKLTPRQCQRMWSEKRNRPEDIGNRPVDYAEKSTEIVDYLVKKVWKIIPHKSRIIEVGCNAGSNLYGLYQAGWRNLIGIDINPEAFTQMEKSFPEMHCNIKLIGANAANALEILPDNHSDLIYSMACLIHIHPDEIDALIGEMTRVSSRFILLIESEEFESCSYIWAHDYRAMIGKRGWKLVVLDEVPGIKGYEGYWTYLFEKQQGDVCTKCDADYPECGCWPVECARRAAKEAAKAET